MLGDKTVVIERRGKKKKKKKHRSHTEGARKKARGLRRPEGNTHCFCQRRTGPPHLVQLLTLCPFPHP